MEDRLFHGLGLKLVALGVAVLLWLSVAGEPIVERGLQIPLEFENVPEALNIAGAPPDTVRVRVRGSSSVVSGLEPGEVVAVLDLAGERPGHRLFDMFAGRVQAPFGIEVAQVVPATITLTLERAGSPRTVRIVPDIEGQPAEGFVAGGISTVPATVDVIGPESRLAELTEALTEPVSVGGKSDRVQAVVAVGVADPMLRLVTSTTAEVTVDIVPAPLERTLHEVPVLVRNAEGRGPTRVEPATITVSVRGSRITVRELDTSAVEAYVDLAGLPSAQYNLPVMVESRHEIGITHIDPPFVRITLR